MQLQKKKGMTQKTMCYLCLSLSVSSLAHPRSCKYNDHRKVMTDLSQSEVSEPTERTQTALHKHGSLLSVHRTEQFLMRA